MDWESGLVRAGERTSSSEIPRDWVSHVADETGIPSLQLLPLLHKHEGLIQGAERLLTFVPEASDPRWRLVNQYVSLLDNNSLKPRAVEWECSLRSIYLSDLPSYRNDYSRYKSLENVRHLARALRNIEVHSSLTELFAEQATQSEAGLVLSLATTDRIMLGTNGNGVTGCPEALYQLRLHHPATGQYLARVGFNFHQEWDKYVLSITNVQGVPGGQELYAELGIDPFHQLIGKLQHVFSDRPAETWQVRGLRNPLRNAALYNTLFKRNGVQRVSAPKVGKYSDTHTELQ